MVRAVPARTDSTTRPTSTSASQGRGWSESRPVSMRATSSSSAISRLSRSESAWTVVSISFFCSSLSLSHRLSIACTKPLTPVSGERSSWATVATRSERSRSSRARPRPLRRLTARPLISAVAASRSEPGGGQHLLAPREQPALLGDAAPDREPANGWLTSSHDRPSLSCSRSTSASGAPTACVDGRGRASARPARCTS